MSWSNIKLIWMREIRDQLRDRRTLFTVAVLPLLLYPMMGLLFLQLSDFARQEPTRVWVVGASQLPEDPPLLTDIDGSPRLVGEGADDRIEITTESNLVPSSADDENMRLAAKSAIQEGLADAVLYIPPDFQQQLAAFRRGLSGGETSETGQWAVPSPQIYYNTAKDKSRIAYVRVDAALRRWREAVVVQTLRDRQIPLAVTRPFEVAGSDVAEAAGRQAALWGKILPFVVLVWALTGAFYPAVDLCAGEKERGTLETLLSSPAQRGEIVWGKLLAIMVFSAATSLLNLASLTGTGLFVMGRLQALGSSALADVGSPPFAALAWLLVVLIPASAMFSALALAIATMARSTKEGQYYLMPLLLISLPLMILPLLPGTELNLGTSLIPLTGLMLLLRTLLEGQYLEALRYALPVVVVTAVCVLVSIRWAIDQFNKESVLFRESERFSLGLWLRHTIRYRGVTPSAQAAIIGGVVLLGLRFMAMFLFPPPQGWSGFATTTLISLVGFIALPAIAMAMLTSRSPRQTLLLNRPRLSNLLAAAGLAVCINPMVLGMGELVRWIYPVSEQTQQKLDGFDHLINAAPGLWAVVLVLALLPAVCEELAFRGFVLSGLRQLGGKWRAVLISAVFFGVAHGMLQQSIMAFFTGVVIGFVAVQTGSLWACIVYHFVHNALLVVMAATISEAWYTATPWLRFAFRPVDNGFGYHWWVTAVSAVLAMAILLWFHRLPLRSARRQQPGKTLNHKSATATSP